MLIHELTFLTVFLLVAFSVVLAFKLPASQRVNRRFVFLFVLLLAHSGALCGLHFYHEAYPADPLVCHFPIDLLFATLLAPGVYFYLSMLLGHIRQKWYRNLLYGFLLVLPSVVYFGVYVFLYLTGNAAVYSRYPETVHRMVILLNVYFSITAVVYLLLSCRKLCALRSAGYRLDIERRRYNLCWLLAFFVLALVGCLVYFVWSHLHQYNHARIEAGLIISNLLVVYLFVCWLWHSRFAGEVVNEAASARVWIEPHDADEYIRQLIQGMESSQVYLQTDCSMADVAGVCNIPVRQLSYLLNHHLQLKFVDFVNIYRLRSATEMLGNLSQHSFTLEEIGRRCGFGSRSNFHRVFKRHTGQSPKFFLQRAKM
jgi:AraC-like DNA-binding protein